MSTSAYMKEFPLLGKGEMKKEQLATAILGPKPKDSRVVRENVVSAGSIPLQSQQPNQHMGWDPKNAMMQKHSECGKGTPSLSSADVNPKREDTSSKVSVLAKEHAHPPKGILRKPTEQFPENPLHSRSRSPPDTSQWTHIHRSLIEPTVLEEANISYRLDSDYVFIHRRLTGEEAKTLILRSCPLRVPIS
jgi:hypothetical protein